MRTLVIDNYDSYTYNLCQLITAVYGRAPVVLANDSPRWQTIDLKPFDALVISPGPGSPNSPRDVGVAVDVMRNAELPTLGVCLGHQTIAWACGGEVVRAPSPRHGHLERINHLGRDLFLGVPQGFTAVRYHSLCVDTPLPPELQPMAWAEDGVIMALRHVERPWWGVQFHPESIATEHGAKLLERFARLARARRRVAASTTRAPERAPLRPVRTDPSTGRWRVLFQCMTHPIDAERAFEQMFADCEYAFWLDSSRHEPGLSRFSFMGDAGGPHGEVLTYEVGTGAVVVRASSGPSSLLAGTMFDVLEARLSEREVASCRELPFDLAGGYVGYFGYEIKADCGSSDTHRSPTPDAVWMAATRFIAVDHEMGQTWAVALCTTAPDSVVAARRWLRDSCLRMAALSPDGSGEPPSDCERPDEPEFDPEPWLVRSRDTYLSDIAECKRQLEAGESYEICLTNTVRLPVRCKPFDLYRRQRRANPAPYAAYLKLGTTHVLCSSPERFLSIGSDRSVESKPIKGTAPRDPDGDRDATLRKGLASDPKALAENLMIVDLLRNDLGRICDAGTISVPHFMAVESYATVHQLVSTIRGRLREDVSAVSAARACLPGGSMTGAPKLRTMEIIDRLEGQARGIYSGTIGFFSVTGAADLNIVIRTAVVDGDQLTVGAGGAIVLDSDPDSEYEEMLLKARAPLRAMRAEWVGSDSLRLASS